MRKAFYLLALLSAFWVSAAAQMITVSPSENTVYSQGATSVLLIFGNLGNRRAVEATFCGAFVPAAPDIGFGTQRLNTFLCSRFSVSSSPLVWRPFSSWP